MEHFDHNDFKLLGVSLPEEVMFYKYSGDFSGEIEAIDRYLCRNGIPEILVKRLKVEKLIAAELLRDYLMPEETLIERVKEKYPHFDAEALRYCMDHGHADFILKNGKRYFQRAARSNILNCCSRYLRGREGDSSAPVISEWKHENAEKMKKNGTRACRFHIKLEIKPDGDENIREGKTLRIHLPFPQNEGEQSEVRLIDSSDPVIINEADQKTAFMETPCVKDKTYFVEFSYINRAKYTDLGHPEEVRPCDITDHLGEEAPHIVFTPFLRALAAEIAGDEKNPLILARKVFNWITENVGYSYMRHYFCLENIAENCALNRRGDCGVQALLFITLCRILGIPARWQSGLFVKEDDIGDHDWAQFYIAPYGWLYADPSFGGGSYREGDTEMRDYYFGNLDCFRMVANREYQADFSPAKYFVRQDPYDNQDGEIEYEDEGLFYGRVDGDKTLISIEELDI